MVVEITPIGIQNLGWQFYIIWTVLNGAFVPIVYLFYPETAGRTLEDMDRYFREQPGVLVFRDKDAISNKRPEKYIEHEEQEVRRASSVGATNMRKSSRMGSVSMDAKVHAAAAANGNSGTAEQVEKV